MIIQLRTIFIGIVVVAGLLLSLVPPVKQVSAEPLRVGVVPTPSFALIYLADSQGFFKKHGVDVVKTTYESGPAEVNDLAAGKIDIAIVSEFVFVLEAFAQPSLRIPAGIWAGSNVDLIVRTERGIKTPQDLKGRRVAVTRGSGGEFFFYQYLIFNRIPSGSVKVVYLVPSEMVKAMAGGTVDAALCWPPFTTEMAKILGAKAARWPAQSGQDYYLVLLAQEAFLKKRTRTVEQFLAALLDAEEFIAKYPDRAQTILRNLLNADAESFPETLSRARFQLQLSQDMLVLMEREAKWAMRNNLVEKNKMPNYLNFFSFNALDKVKSEAVSIVH
ncbi:MAG TPA: ABC transporter substrate-binding protein [Syntrophorhabdales bacterium]|nr:ABC transporter substrate-binding protein [Syntrophorhabdales bacterium]